MPLRRRGLCFQRLVRKRLICVFASHCREVGLGEALLELAHPRLAPRELALQRLEHTLVMAQPRRLALELHALALPRRHDVASRSVGKRRRDNQLVH